jgi:tetratricopeptide (TPR) repeat protein
VTDELDPELHTRISQLSEEGNALADSGDTLAAWKKFAEALNLLPEPATDYEATTWLLASIGDMAFQSGHFDKAKDAFSDAVQCPGGLGNVFVHLRLGECFFELGDEQRAGDNLTRAYMGGGREPFRDEDPKYFALLERLLEPPVGHDHL